MESIDMDKSKVRQSEPILTPFEPVNNSGLYEVNCVNGHNSKTALNNIDFEILFDYSINAIVDGYYREAVSSFTSSMERYFEFFVKVILHSNGLDFELIDKSWKKISNQSERQLGAYIMLYTQTFIDEPFLLGANKEIPFRNSVIHKGYIPNKDETLKYGNSIMKIIETSLIKLKNRFPKFTKDVFDYYGYLKTAEELVKKIEVESGIEQHLASVNIMTILNVKSGRELDKDDYRIGTVEELLQRVIERRKPRELILKDEPKS